VRHSCCRCRNADLCFFVGFFSVDAGEIKLHMARFPRHGHGSLLLLPPRHHQRVIGYCCPCFEAAQSRGRRVLAALAPNSAGSSWASATMSTREEFSDPLSCILPWPALPAHDYDGQYPEYPMDDCREGQCFVNLMDTVCLVST